jgi:hypothetical protein
MSSNTERGEVCPRGGQRRVREASQMLWMHHHQRQHIVDDSNDETCIEGIGSCVPHPDNIHKGCIIGDGALVYSGLMSNIGYEDDISNIDDALGIATVDDNNKKLNMVEAEDICTKLYSCISIWKGEAD